MSILITGMEMPKFGALNIFVLPDGKVLGEVSGQAPLRLNILGTAVPVPTPHGRLIDADDLQELYEPAPEDVNEWEHYTTTISVIRQNIKDAPTVIEAEADKA